MTTDQPSPPKPRRRRFQFSIASLLATMVIVAVLCCIVFSIPNHIYRGALLLVMSMVLPAILATILLCGGKQQRAFSIGALFPTGVALFSLVIMVGMRLTFPL